MSGLTKKLPTKNVTVSIGTGKREFLVPEDKARGLVNLIQEYEVASGIPADNLFANINKKHSKTGALLRGVRLREAMTQTNLADTLGIPQSHISEMECGKRTIGKKMAQRLGKVLRVSYKIFL